MKTWDTTARTLWALMIGCFATAGGYGVQSLFIPFPAQPQFGVYGSCFLFVFLAYEWARKRARAGERR